MEGEPSSGTRAMSKGRLEAFSDAILAIIMTIMVLELRAPEGVDPGGLLPVVPDLLSYAMSFVFLAIYWNNHHHLLQTAARVDGRVLWANMHLLFWLSLIPFVTAWMGESNFAAWPMAVYGIVLVLAAAAYLVLTRALIALHGRDSTLARAVGRDFKGTLSVALYLTAIPLAFVSAAVSGALYVLVAIIWLIPDPRIEKSIGG